MKKRILGILIMVLMTIVCVIGLSACDTKGNYLEFNTLTVAENKVQGRVSNDTEEFSFIDEIKANGDSKFIVSLDIMGTQLVSTKTIPLSVGDNKVYITEIVNDEPVNVYEVTIRRTPIYTVSFDTKGGSEIESQYIELEI